MILIAALGPGRVIGSGDGMPWNVPEEYARFLGFVRGRTVLMGRRSWEIFGADLESAHNVVVSRSVASLPGAEVAADLDRAVDLARSYDKTVFSAGGARIYEQTLPLADEMYLSYIKGRFEGDAFFPEFDPGDWDVVQREDHPAFEFVHYRRR